MSPENSAQESPLVSVICRSIARPELRKALESVSAQTYPNLEIVLVDALGKGLGDVSAWCGKHPILRIGDGKLHTRSQSANAGLDAATGDYLMFLDDDDWIAPAHIENLVRCLQQQSHIKAAYSNTQKTDRSGALLDYVFKHTFDAVLLMRDNYIPIHAMLFSRTLLRMQCRFDEAFDIYEDWDFWLQLNQHTAFAHVDTITAFYREGGESATAEADTAVRYNNDSLLGKSRAAIFSKWMPRWSGTQLNQLIGSLDQSLALRQLADELHSVRLSMDAAITGQQKLASANAQLQGEIDRCGLIMLEQNEEIKHLLERVKEIRHLRTHNENQERHILEITAALQRIYASLSWRLMGPFRRAYRFFIAPYRNRSNQD